MVNNRKAGLFLEILPLLLIFIVGTAMILAIGFFLLSWFSSASSATGYSVLGTNCLAENCKKINAGVMGLIIIFLIIFQYGFYNKYKQRKLQKK